MRWDVKEGSNGGVQVLCGIDGPVTLVVDLDSAVSSCFWRGQCASISRSELFPHQGSQIRVADMNNPFVCSSSKSWYRWWTRIVNFTQNFKLSRPTCCTSWSVGCLSGEQIVMFLTILCRLVRLTPSSFSARFSSPVMQIPQKVATHRFAGTCLPIERHM